MKNTEMQNLKRSLKRLALFLGIVLVPCLVVCVLLFSVDIPNWLVIFILVLILCVLYFLFLFVCAKIDKKKEDRLKNKKDPFA